MNAMVLEAAALDVAAERLGRAAGGARRVRAVSGAAAVPQGHAEACASLGEAFAARIIAIDDGHVDWVGPLSAQGVPVVRCRGLLESAYRFAFRAHHRREPVGKTVPACDWARCVAGEHLEDRALRETRARAEALARARSLVRVQDQNGATNAELGARVRVTPPAGATWHGGIDLLAVERLVAGAFPRPRLTPIEQRYAVVVGTHAGLGAGVIADRLGLPPRTVDRWRDEAGLSAPAG